MNRISGRADTPQWIWQTSTGTGHFPETGQAVAPRWTRPVPLWHGQPRYDWFGVVWCGCNLHVRSGVIRFSPLPKSVAKSSGDYGIVIDEWNMAWILVDVPERAVDLIGSIRDVSIESIRVMTDDCDGPIVKTLECLFGCPVIASPTFMTISIGMIPPGIDDRMMFRTAVEAIEKRTEITIGQPLTDIRQDPPIEPNEYRWSDGTGM